MELNHSLHGHSNEEYNSSSKSESTYPSTEGSTKKIIIGFLVAFIVIFVFIAILIWLTKPSVLYAAAFYLILWPTNTACSTRRLE